MEWGGEKGPTSKEVMFYFNICAGDLEFLVTPLLKSADGASLPTQPGPV